MKLPAHRSPRIWSQLNRRRAFVLQRDGYRCRIWGPNCDRRATEIAPADGADDHSLENLVAVCRPCLAAREQAEQDQDEAELAATRLRRPERHPGARR